MDVIKGMTARTYYRLSLLLPILIPITAFFLMPNTKVSALLGMSLSFGGLAYLFFSLILFYLVGSLKPLAKVQKLVYFSPLFFIPFQGIFWIVQFLWEKQDQPDLTGGWEALVISVPYIIVIGYIYVAIVSLSFYVLNRAGFVTK